MDSIEVDRSATNNVLSLGDREGRCQESPLRQSGTYVAPGRGAWAETKGRGLEGTGQVVGQRGDDSSDAKPHAQHAGGAGLSRRQDWGPS